MSHVLCKQRVVWDHTQLGGSGRGIRASKEEGGQEGEQSGDGAMSWSQRDDSEEGRAVSRPIVSSEAGLELAEGHILKEHLSAASGPAADADGAKPGVASAGEGFAACPTKAFPGTCPNPHCVRDSRLSAKSTLSLLTSPPHLS